MLYRTFMVYFRNFCFEYPSKFQRVFGNYIWCRCSERAREAKEPSNTTYCTLLATTILNEGLPQETQPKLWKILVKTAAKTSTLKLLPIIWPSWRCVTPVGRTMRPSGTPWSLKSSSWLKNLGSRNKLDITAATVTLLLLLLPRRSLLTLPLSLLPYYHHHYHIHSCHSYDYYYYCHYNYCRYYCSCS